MKICTFFGHRDCGEAVVPALRKTVIACLQKGVTDFYVGHEGQFDALALACLRQLSVEYPHMRYVVVLAYVPTGPLDFSDPTLLPDGIERVPRRFAIAHRNRWMIDRADCVIAYVTHSFGGAAACARRAERLGKQVIYL